MHEDKEEAMAAALRLHGPPRSDSRRDITVFGGGPPHHARTRMFTIDGAKVTVDADSTTHYDDAALGELAESVYDATHDVRSVIVACAERVRVAERAAKSAELKLELLRERMPAEPSMILGVGCVRFNKDGEMWALNKRETGWSSSGFRVDGWDEFFRRWRAVVLDVGTDEWGPYVAFGPKAVP